MASAHLSYSHHRVRRKVGIDGKALFHRQCTSCGRDFVMGADTGGWRAVHVGLLGFDCLDEKTNDRWLSAECPGQQMPDEINDQRMTRETSVPKQFA